MADQREFNEDFIQRMVNDSTGAQLVMCIGLCKQFIEQARRSNEFLEAEPAIKVIARLRDCCLAEALRLGLNFTL